ncbi:MAG: hypothetical protein GWP91_17600, partial [Rhodobacterales bacterium]|nr:hypothetical protein [Rhodobacterales bacterium]
MAEARDAKSKLMIVLFDEPESDITKALYPLPLLDFYNRGANHHVVQSIAPWGADETQAFLESKSITADAARIAEIATGRPGFIAELVEILVENDQISGNLSEVTLASLVPTSIDESELEVPDAPAEEGKRQYANADDASRVAYLAALMGQAFPSRLVADMGGFVPESIDDLIDAQDDLFAEVQFSKEMNTWIYRFKRGSWREGVLEANQDDEGLDLARRVGLFMERFLVPRGYGFIAKTARVYAENGAGARAANMRSVALTNDSPDAWGLCYDLSRYFDEVTWPDTLRKTLWMNLLDRMVNGGNVQVAEKVHLEATAWATEHAEEREFNAWLLFSGSRLDARRQDLYRARDRGNDALKLYEALENKARVAEVYTHLAMIEVQDGNLNAAMEKVSEALKAGQVETKDGKTGFIPGVLASSEHIRGLVNRRAGKLEEAAEHFKRANEVAGQSGLSALALDSGLSFGEALLAGRKVEEARDVLLRVVGIAKAVGNPQREHNATQLLSQAHGALKEFDQAIAAAGRTLQLSQQLKLQQSLPIDLYNLGFFHFAAGKPTEALVFLKQADQVADTLGDHPIVKELAYFKGMAHMQAGEKDAARSSLEKAVGLSEKHKDWNKLCSSLEHLGGLAEQSGDKPSAKAHLSKAVQLANAHDQLKDARKGLRKKLDAVS